MVRRPSLLALLLLDDLDLDLASTPYYHKYHLFKLQARKILNEF